MLAGNLFAWKLRNSHLDSKSNITLETMLAAKKQVPNVVKRDTPIEVPIHITVRIGKLKEKFSQPKDKMVAQKAHNFRISICSCEVN